MRDSLELKDYAHLANINGLTFLGSKSPESVWETVSWQCDHCGRKLKKSYHTLKYQNNPCRCHAQKYQKEDYRILARAIGGEWVGNYLPHSTKRLTLWFIDGIYRTLSYDEVKKKLSSIALSKELW